MPSSAQNRVRLTFPATLENAYTSDVITEPFILERLKGVRPSDSLASCLNDTLFPKLDRLVDSLYERLWYQDGALVLEVAVHFFRPVGPEETELVAQFCRLQIEGAWGLNKEFHLPRPVEEHHVVHISSTPREAILSLRSAKMADALNGWENYKDEYGRLIGLRDEELDALIARLEPWAEEYDEDDELLNQLLRVYGAARSQRQRRRLTRKHSPTISLDGEMSVESMATAIDSLPPDVL